MHGAAWPLTLLCSGGSSHPGCVPPDAVTASPPKEAGGSASTLYDISPSDLRALARIAGLEQTCGEAAVSVLGPRSAASGKREAHCSKSRCRQSTSKPTAHAESMPFGLDTWYGEDVDPRRGTQDSAPTSPRDDDIAAMSPSRPQEEFACWPSCSRPCGPNVAQVEERAAAQRQMQELKQHLHLTQQELAQERSLREEAMTQFSQMAHLEATMTDRHMHELGNKVRQLEAELEIKAESSVHADTFRQLQEKVYAGQAGEWSEFQHLMRRVELMDALAASQGRELENLRQRLENVDAFGSGSSTSGSPVRRSDPGRPILQPGWVGL